MPPVQRLNVEPSENTTTVLVAVGSAKIREALVAAVGAFEGFEVVAEAATDEQAISSARELHPHLAIVDDELPICGAWTVEQLRSEDLTQAVIAIGPRADELTTASARLAGAVTHLQTGASTSDLLNALEQALASARPTANR